MFKRTSIVTLAASLGLALTATGAPPGVDDGVTKAPPQTPVLGQYEKEMPRERPDLGGPLGDGVHKYPAKGDPGFGDSVKTMPPKRPDLGGPLGDGVHKYPVKGEDPGFDDFTKVDPKDDGCYFIGDVNRDGHLDFMDVVVLLSQWGDCVGCTGDLNQDGWVDVQDLVRLLSYFGPEPEPEVQTGGDFLDRAPKLRNQPKRPPADTHGGF